MKIKEIAIDIKKYRI